jgi:hypothetical protein
VATDEREAFLDGPEHWLVRFDIDVDVFEFADLLAVAVNQLLAVPLGDVPMRNHQLCLLPATARRGRVFLCRGFAVTA